MMRGARRKKADRTETPTSDNVDDDNDSTPAASQQQQEELKQDEKEAEAGYYIPVLESANTTGKIFRRRSSSGVADNSNSRGEENDEDEESNRFFMSEPSASEGGTTTQSSTDNNRRRRLSSTQQQQRPSLLWDGKSPHSPGGNTSLSSWDSPAVHKKVFLQFPAPVRRTASANNAVGQQQQQQEQPNNNATATTATTNSNSGSDKEVPNGVGPTATVLVPPTPISMSDREISGVTLPNLDEVEELYRKRNFQSDNHRVGVSDESSRHSLQLSTDDAASSTAVARSIPPQQPDLRKNKRRGLLHKRTRSGDSAAANLWMRGGTDWKGMEQDRIPMPSPDDYDDDEDEEDENGVHVNVEQGGDQGEGTRRKSRQRSPPQDIGHRRMHTPPMYDPRMAPPPYPTTSYGSMNFGTPPSQWGNHPPPHPHLYPPHPMVDTQASWMSHMSQLDPSPHQAPYGRPIVGNEMQMSFSDSSFQPASPREYRVPMATSRNRKDANNSSDEADEVYTTGSDDPECQVSRNQLPLSGDYGGLADLERQFGSRQFRGAYQNVMHSRLTSQDTSPFANLGKSSVDKIPRRSAFLPTTLLVEHDPHRYPTYLCPRCGTRQREFFSVIDAPRQVEGPSGYLAVYFAIYVVASLFIFGLEEGWKPLDCIYFAVVTLTTAGLGDFVPTTDANKLICSIFIYFGVACIGLLLGSYIAGLLDERASRDRESKMINSCPNCARIRTLKDKATRRVVVDNSQILPSPLSGRDPSLPHDYHECSSDGGPSDHQHIHNARVFRSSRTSRELGEALSGSSSSEDEAHRNHYSTPPARSNRRTLDSSDKSKTVPPKLPSSQQDTVLGSPVTRQILGRQRHTRHQSFAAGTTTSSNNGPVRKFSVDLGNIAEIPPAPPKEPAPIHKNASRNSLHGMLYEASTESDYDSVASSHLTDTSLLDEQQVRIKTAKYVFLTLRQALVNSMVIIAVGSVGFFFIENWSMVNSWYYTTVFLTTVGYGDIVPVTSGGKLFATVYILVAGTILLNNMSSISLIPLELRKRRLQQAVLTQFGDQLDDAALRELATGPVIQRLRLAGNHPDGLDECTREMFSLAMLVRMGKVSEEEIRQTFAAFRRLDVNDEGVLNSKSIIAAMIQKRKAEKVAAETIGYDMDTDPRLSGYWGSASNVATPQYPYLPTQTAGNPPLVPVVDTERTALLK